MILRRPLFATGLLLLLCVPSAHAASTELISVNNLGVPCPSYGSSSAPMLSGDGRYAAFTSDSTELVPGDTNGSSDLFLRDRAMKVTRRVYVNAESSSSVMIVAPSAGFSYDGRYLIFTACVDVVPEDEYDLGAGRGDVFLYDVELGTFEMVSIGDSEQMPNDCSQARPSSPASYDATYVAFDSWASNLVPDDTNGCRDVFVRNRSEGTTELISIATSREQGDDESSGAVINADGRCVAFTSMASNLAAEYTGDAWQVYLRDRVTGTTELVSVGTSGAPGNYESYATGISGDGRFVVFESESDNLVPNDTNGYSDVFVRDRVAGTTELVSVGLSGLSGHLLSLGGRITPDGRWVCFLSAASDLVEGDTNKCWDVFVRDRQEGTTERVSVNSVGEEIDRVVFGSGGISHDGRYVGFTSGDCDLVPGPCDPFSGYRYQFVRDREGRSSFPDVPATYWACWEIDSCVSAGIVCGYDDGLYRPELAVTRDQMAVYIARALVAPSGEAGLEDYVPADPRNFPDAPPTGYGDDGTEPFWAYIHIEYCVENEVVAGYEDGNYHPEYDVTRAEMAVYVARALVAPSGEAGLADYVPADPRNFPDVPPTGYGDDGAEPYWAYTHIEYCVEHAVVQGYLDGYYHPDEVVTRAQMAVYIARAFGLAM